MTQETRNKLGWIYKVEADKLGDEVKDLTLAPDETERQKIADLLDIPGVNSLKADLKFSRVQGGMVVKIDGVFTADVTQTCVVTLDPIENKVRDEFTAWYADPDQAISFNKVRKQRELEKQHGEVPIVDEKDDPEPVENGQIDLGDVVTQFLSLALDPYPHKEGVSYEIGDDEKRAETSPIRKNPFEKLKEWKSDQ
ncbi:MAG: YceD family protein [Alphaproteobacteria bacterium]